MQQRKHDKGWSWLRWSLVGVMFLAGCSTVAMTGRKRVAFMPAGQMTAMGAENYQGVMKEAKLSKNKDQVAMVKKIGQRIAASAETFMRENGLEKEISLYQWEFNLIEEDETVNAFCMPGGKVAVYSGILPISKDETGLAVIMGHEVAHAIAKHGNERMSQLMLVELGGVALDVAMKEKPEETRKLFMGAYGLGANYGVVLPYSRAHESEADRIGLILMARAGYDPRVAAVFWGRMGASGGSRPPELLSTHPSPDTRIKKLEELIPEALPYYEKSQVQK